ncbi:MAG: hypothetical protein KF684_07950 [Phycisphaeraceae bacterium]|nr:hypothetical protein [Phycisphaeraceae bacterium]
MSIGERPSWLSSPSLASQWPVPVRWLRMWGKVWVILAAISFVLLTAISVFWLAVAGWKPEESGIGVGPWHSAFGFDDWRFWIAAPVMLGGVLATIASLVRPRAVIALMVCAVIAVLADRLLSPTQAQIAQQRYPALKSLFVPGNPRSVASVVFEVAMFASVFLAWLHLAFVRDPCPKPWECPHCAYDARGLPTHAEQCPECGLSLCPPVKVKSRRLRR